MKRNRECRLRRVLVGALLCATVGTVFAAPVPASAQDLATRNGASASTSASDPHLSFGTWRDFQFGGRGSFNSEGVFTFFSSSPVLLRVTDGLCRGDRFRVYDRGYPIFLSTKVATDPSCDDRPFVGSPGTAWLDQTYSKGHFLLEPGYHRVRIQAVASPFGAGSAWLKAVVRPAG